MPEGFRIATAWVSVSPDTEGFKEELKAKLDEETAGVEGKVKVTLDTSELDAKADEARAKVDELDSRLAEPSVRLDSADLDAKADEARAKLDDLNAKSARPDLGIAANDLDAKIDEAKTKLDELNAKHADPRLDLNTSEFNAKLDEANAKLDEFNAKSATARLGASGGGAGGSGGESGFLGGHGLLAGITAGVAGLLPGVGGAATGLGLLGGVGAMALGPVAKAVSEAHQASMNVGITPQQMAATQFSNSVAVQQAQQQVGLAHEQAAEDAVTAAHSIESAQMNLASVERSTAESQIQALHSVEQAQQGLEQANYGLSEAQYNLNQAWVQAREEIVQLNDQLADSKINVQSAQLAIQQAIYQQRLVDQNAYSTQLEREQAALAVVRAQQQLKDASDQETASAYAANLANKQGVEHSQLVIQAKQQLTQAQYAQTNAQYQAADAQRQLALTEINNAQQVKQAQMQLAQAQQQAAYQQMRDAQQVAIAERNVTNTIKEQQLQMAATMSTSNQAANQFAKDMARMTPAGRALVEQLLSMRGAFKGLETAAQTAIAPGLTLWLQGLDTLMPTIQTGMTKMGGAISKAFGEIGKTMSTPAAAHVLDGLINNGIQFADTVLPAFGQFIEELGLIGSKQGAVSGLANLLAGITNALTNVAKGVAPFTSSLGSVFTTLGKALEPVGTLLGRTVGQLAQAIAPALHALLPAVSQLAGALGPQLGQALAATAPGLTALAQALVALLPGVTPLIGLFGSGLNSVLKLVSGTLEGLNTFIQANAAWLRPLAGIVIGVVAALKLWSIAQAALNLVLEANPIGIVITAIAALVGGVIYAYGHVKWFRDGVNDAWHLIATSALWLWHEVLDPMWQGIEAGSIWLYQNGILPLYHGIKDAFGWIESAAMWMWHNVFDPLWQGIEAGARGFVSAFQTVWHGLEDVFRVPVNFLIDPVYKNIRDLWDGVVEKVGLGKLDMPELHKFAGGGIIPGYAPGKDTVPAMLSPGEAVLTPGAARALGHGTIESLNSAHRPGGPQPAAGHYGWGLNPINDVKQLGHDIASGFHKAADIAKIVAALTTGNSTALGNALNDLVGTNAVGDYAKVMVGLPKALISNVVKSLMNFFTGGSGGSGSVGGSIPSGQHLAVIDEALAAAGVPPPGTKQQWEAGLNTLITRESGWNPRAINLTDSNAAAGDPSRGLAQTIMSTFLGYHVQGTSTDIYDPVANIASAVRYIVATYGNITNVQQANASLPPKGYDQGGWLMPGDLPVNGLRRPEAVLTPDQSDWLRTMAQQGAANRAAGADLGAKPVVINFNGTQYPTGEQMAAIKREMTMALGGAT